MEFIFVLLLVAASFGQVKDDGYLKAFDDAVAKAKADSIYSSDSVRLTASEVIKVVDSFSIDTAKVQRIVDSIVDIVSKDSVEEYGKAVLMFKGQLNLKKSVSVEIKLSCLEFLIRYDLRRSDQVTSYLTCLSKLCKDRQDLYYNARQIVDPGQKYLCMGYFKRAQAEYGKIQEILVSHKFTR